MGGPAVLSIISLSLVLPCRIQATPPSVYVAMFRSDQDVHTDLLWARYRRVRSGLSELDAYEVLERLRFADLDSEIRNESAIQGDPALRQKFRMRGAQAIILALWIFGACRVLRWG